LYWTKKKDFEVEEHKLLQIWEEQYHAQEVSEQRILWGVYAVAALAYIAIFSKVDFSIRRGVNHFAIAWIQWAFGTVRYVFKYAAILL
jgi:hypothetical protein